MKKSSKIIFEIVLGIAVVCLTWLFIASIQKPVKFNEAVKARSAVGIQRLKDIRTLQEAFKGQYGHFSPSVDSLKLFFEEGQMNIVMQIGSMDDSIAVVNTNKIKKANPRLKGDKLTEKLAQAYANGTPVVFSTITKIPVKDTLFTSRADFSIDSLYFIPFSGRDSVQMESTVKKVSGVQVPLFEARMPYKSLLKGLDNQLRINLDASCRDQDNYEGLRVGNVSTPNNNAGNWE